MTNETKVPVAVPDESGLLPCPFCGSQAVRAMWYPENVETGMVRCVEDGCPIEDMDVPAEDWNRRAPTPPAQEQAEQQCPQCAGTGYDCPDCISAAEHDAVMVPRELLEQLAAGSHIDPDCCVAYYRGQLRALLGGDA